LWAGSGAGAASRFSGFQKSRHQLREILEPLWLAELADEDQFDIVRELARQLAAIPEPIREEHAAA
jgi:hypothetical protein